MEIYESKIRNKVREIASGLDIPTGQDNEDYELIKNYITKHKPKCIVEYGSGFSTRIIQKTINELKLDTKFFSFEDNKHYYNFIKEHIELTDAMELCPIQQIGDWEIKGTKKLARYHHSYDEMKEVDFIILDGPDVGRYDIAAIVNVIDLHERFSTNTIKIFIQGRRGTTDYYIDKYGDKFYFEGKNGWGTL